MKGSAEALKWARRDVGDIDQVLALVPGRTAVVQAGGNLGVYPKRLAQLFTTVYTFEPSPSLFPMLASNVPEPNVVKLQAAVGWNSHLVGTSQTRRDGKRNAHEGITHIVPNGVIPMLRIDDLALPVCDLLWLDVEGFELDALRGATSTIARCTPVIVVEINKNLEYYGYDASDIYAYLAQRAYRSVMRLHSDEVFVPREHVS